MILFVTLYQVVQTFKSVNTSNNMKPSAGSQIDGVLSTKFKPGGVYRPIWNRVYISYKP